MQLEGLNNLIKEVGQDKASAMLYGAVALFAGRKFCYAGLYKAGAKAAQLIGSKHAAADWNKSGDECFAKAKKDVLRDLGVTVGLLTAATFVAYAGETFRLEKEAKKLEEETKLAQEKKANQPLLEQGIEWVKENPKAAVVGSFLVPYSLFNFVVNFPYQRGYGNGPFYWDPSRLWGAWRNPYGD